MSPESTFDTSVEEVSGAESLDVSVQALQESLDWFFIEVASMRLSELLKFEAVLRILTPKSIEVLKVQNSFNKSVVE